MQFTLRGEGRLIRVISARDMHRKEKLRYAHETKPFRRSRAKPRNVDFGRPMGLSADYLDWSKAERVRLPNLKPSTTADTAAPAVAAAGTDEGRRRISATCRINR